MSALPVSVKLRCASWEQVEAIYKRDLIRNALFLKSGNPPAVGTLVTVELTLPSDTVVSIKGVVAEHVAAGGANGRGPGVEVRFDYVPQSAMWIIETALARERTSGSASQTAASALITSLNEKTRAGTEPGLKAMTRQPDLSAEHGAPLTNAETELVMSLAEELASLRRLNAFQILGVSYDASDSDIRLAFAELTKRYHPDRFAKYASAQLRMHAADIFILIRDAYQKLGDAQQRAAAAAAVRSGAARPAPAPTPAAPSKPAAVVAPRALPPIAPSQPASPPRPGASTKQQLGTAATTPQRTPLVAAPPQVPLAPQKTAPMTNFKPAGARAEGWLAQVDGLLGAKQYDAAASVARGQLQATPGDHVAKAYVDVCNGYRALADGDRLEAAERFEAALEIDPSNDRAARELADMRRRATNERKGHLTRLMTKKD
ncbi:MAG: DnaJ domain-containing protein [Myxococcales bacterium]|nr:DnaJ domain-containing protein [Myxococcales bacterium]